LERSKSIILALVTLNSVRFAIAASSKVSTTREHLVELNGPSEIDESRKFEGESKRCNFTL